MLIDRLCPDFDATRVEHRIVEEEPAALYEAVLRADFIEAWRANLAVRVLFALRSWGERLIPLVRSRAQPEPSQISTMRLADRPTSGGVGAAWPGPAARSCLRRRRPVLGRGDALGADRGG